MSSETKNSTVLKFFEKLFQTENIWNVKNLNYNFKLLKGFSRGGGLDTKIVTTVSPLAKITFVFTLDGIKNIKYFLKPEKHYIECAFSDKDQEKIAAELLSNFISNEFSKVQRKNMDKLEKMITDFNNKIK